MKKIGLLMSSEKAVSSYLYDLYEFLSKHDEVELFILISDSNIKRPKKNLIDRVNAIALNTLLKIEEKLFGDALTKKIFISKEIEFKAEKLVTVFPVFSKSGLYVNYESVEVVRDLELDLIIRGNAPGIFKGDILGASKLGILSFHHGDNRWNRGSAPCFWEVYYKKRGTGFILQLLNNTLDGGKVVRRGTYQTKGTYVNNLASVYAQSNEEMFNFLNSWIYNDEIKVEESFPFDRKVNKSPKLNNLLVYVIKTYSTKLKQALANRKLIYKPDWSVGFSYGEWRQASLSRVYKLGARSNTFIADPFPYQHSTGDYVFLEEFEYSEKKGSISVYKVSRDGSSEYLGKVIEEDFHLSFPYIFEFNSELYMVPESSENRDVRLYKCTSFPLEWEFVHTIFNNVNYADSMIFEWNGFWALMTNRASSTGEHNSNLSIYTAESPLSRDWKVLDEDVYLNSETARNGGILRDAGKLYRVSQCQGYNNYGESFMINEIIELSSNDYKESVKHIIMPKFLKNQKCTHHFSNWNDLYVIDFKG